MESYQPWESQSAVAVHIQLDNLPKPPPPPSATNLDVTALCALCSEVCNGIPDSPEIEAWADHKPYLKVSRNNCLITQQILSTDELEFACL